MTPPDAEPTTKEERERYLERLAYIERLIAGEDISVEEQKKFSGQEYAVEWVIDFERRLIAQVEALKAENERLRTFTERLTTGTLDYFDSSADKALQRIQDNARAAMGLEPHG